ncbi:MAG: hypothetical protein HC765_00765 [Brachymonas sp.]|nr:hypothetical protein [Brachymonas sp.]
MIQMRSLLLLGALIASSANAGIASGVFTVSVAQQPRGICISSSLSQVTNAIVRVTCQGNQFVSIEPQPGRPFVGTHGGA